MARNTKYFVRFGIYIFLKITKSIYANYANIESESEHDIDQRLLFKDKGT